MPSHSANAMSYASVDCAKLSISTMPTAAPRIVLKARQVLFCIELALVASETEKTVHPAQSGSSSSKYMARYTAVSDVTPSLTASAASAGHHRLIGSE